MTYVSANLWADIPDSLLICSGCNNKRKYGEKGLWTFAWEGTKYQDWAPTKRAIDYLTPF